MTKEWESFVRSRINELHPFVFTPTEHNRWPHDTVVRARMAYRAYYKILHFDLGCGRSGVLLLPQLNYPYTNNP